MKYSIKKISADKISQHHIHRKFNTARTPEIMEVSIKKTGGVPIHNVVVVPDPEKEGYYLLISGMIKLDAQINNGANEIEVKILDLRDENEITDYVIEANNQKELDGSEKLMLFRHYQEKYPAKKGVKGSRYTKIGKEIHLGFEKVKELVQLDNFFSGDGEIILEKLFGGELSVREVGQIKKTVEENPEKFNSPTSFEKIINPKFDYGRLSYAVQNLSIDKEDEFKLIKSYLNKEYTTQVFHDLLVKIGRIENIKSSHNKNKVFTPILTDTYTTENSHIIKGDNRIATILNPFSPKLQCIVGSPQYGDKRKNSDDGETKKLPLLSGEDQAILLADTYERYIPYLKEDGSVYVVIDDYLYNGAQACSLEYFVVEMLKRGFHLISRYKWVKNNTLPRNYNIKPVVNGFEMAYRFVLDTKNYYTNPDLFIETENGLKVSKGCTNHSNTGETKRGGLYVQGDLKKPRNTLNWEVCDDVIKSNVANPEDFFRQVDEKYHSSQYPPEVCAFFIAEGSRPGDLIGDIWNGVGNTMTAALLMGRKYVGIEIENNYFQQTCRKAKATEKMLTENVNYNQLFHQLNSTPVMNITSRFKHVA